MRPLVLFCLLYLTISSQAQAPPTAPFLLQLIANIPSGIPLHGLHLDGRVQFTSGSLHETGTGTLQAQSDGTFTVTLGLDTASQTETYPALGLNRSCHFTNHAGVTKELPVLDCLTPVAWFAPSLFVQDPLHLSPLLQISDNGELTKDGLTVHELTYGLAPSDHKAVRDPRFVEATSVHFFFDPKTLLISSIEYDSHPNGDIFVPIPVRLVFSDFRNTTGVMLPYHIEKYVNRSLQLTLDVDTAVLS